ncbi:hypothetical protein FWP33_18645 [Vibrio parahaemolyticus]|uniref:Uncharacterized protein n=2 Tax=Vibrio harveyi group TaxID=717610 RepID=A0A9Q3U7N4_VIBPH|nr:hypothetical protein [Vibrio parahaemolyticus]ELA8176757.1 hypothetical protein [Vibrio alginolyticus]CAH1598912.1 hypothetical protein THF1C08_50310 [Vibrio jasicida]EGQ9744522.1 hypothetical protein [Vibrio parahaemolyticus]EJC7176196.1 hypothetical protein [Vibrio parahaemolyticus]EJE4724636.1 hypothetical protein [Vibrio parahaemolyticus]
MSQHIINFPVNDEKGNFKEQIVLTFGWDNPLSQLFAQSHREALIEGNNGDSILEAIDGTLTEKNISIRPTDILQHRHSTLELVRDNVYEIASDTGMNFSSKVLSTLNTICERMIQDATENEFKQRVETYEI